jgi:hypothetical protein
MLYNATAQNDHAGVDAEHGQPVDPSQVIQNVDYLHIDRRQMINMPVLMLNMASRLIRLIRRRSSRMSIICT